MNIEIPIKMGAHERPNDVLPFQIEEFDSTKFSDAQVKQVLGAIDCIKIIHSCLKQYFDGQVHMYKPISAQLRILFCDTKKRKDNSLMNRIHPNIRLLAFKEIKFEDLGGPISVASAPYVITARADGVVDAKLDIAVPYSYLPLSEWRKQIVELHPEVTLNDIIRSVADQDGGAHLDDNECEKLTILRGHNPTQIGSNILFIISLAHCVIDLANNLVPLWMKNNKVSV
ncbi:hypothetical protein [Marinobacterium rhizophilum]|uniref:hypothetical protein n=1 Tax=Marinobacterium rhizophilum TaxID=420402 RepID=UPI0003745458|nr:hypothetical protein [Marinobacterium rhizophilum]